ncbi:hypothetical protein [Oligoflexus tunisiensis]|uniref:hypothetical protein n=1 Tax=Oligoflexus tunisiensis TaxID=708132 RepID=UPI00114D2141|nr:hypothetical protein [Oligoflexus tunisiensis]
MLSPTIHGTMPPLHLMPLDTHRVDRFFVLSFNRYRGSLFVVSPDEITLVDNYYALPGQTLGAYVRAMENQVFETVRNVRPILCLAAKEQLRQRFESISRILSLKSLSLDRYYGPDEQTQLHRSMMALILRKAGDGRTATPGKPQGAVRVNVSRS